MGNKKVFLAGLIMLAFSAADLPGQSTSARIVGTVKNEEGTCLSGVTVSAVHIGKNAEVTCISDKGGAFRLLGLTPGNYQVGFDRPGYQSYVAAGITLLVEQSLTLNVKLKKDELSTEVETITDTPMTESQAEQFEKMKSYKDRGRFSVNLGFGPNYLAVGDTNAYLEAFSYRAGGFVAEQFKALHNGNDLNAEISYRITPRWEIGLGLGLVQGHLRDTVLKNYPFWYQNSPVADGYLKSVNLKAIPLQLICRYRFGQNDRCLYSVYGAILYNFATWSMDSHYWRSYYRYNSNILLEHDTAESASGHGLGMMAGCRAEVVLEKNFALTIDLGGRFAPLRNFSGRREYSQRIPFSAPQISRGKLWFFEYYDKEQEKWVWDLGVGDRPTGPETRNVSSAKVDFSGLALRVGVMFKF